MRHAYPRVQLTVNVVVTEPEAKALVHLAAADPAGAVPLLRVLVGGRSAATSWKVTPLDDDATLSAEGFV